MKKKLLSLAMATAICISAVSCGDTSDGTTTGTSATTDGTTGTSSTAVTTQIPGGLKPNVDENSVDNVTVDMAGVAKLIYNPAYCDIEYKIEDAVGAKKNITLSVKMKNGYAFDGWSASEVNSKKETVGGPVCNGGKVLSKETVYTFANVSASKQMTIYANYSAQIEYDPNGGSVANGSDKYTQLFSVVGYKSPSTLPEKGYFKRDGYTLVEYNTKADGTGESVSLGSKIGLTDSGSLKLYCIWEKQTPEADFTVSQISGGVTITKYNGARETECIVIPDTIGGKKVVSISANAFKHSLAKKVILSKNVTTVADNAFASCKNLETFVMFDSVMDISDKSFTAGTVKNLRVNAVHDLYNNWTVSYANPKMDRLIWAKANGKKVIAIYGGSGSLYGWDCAAIEEAFGGEYVVINMGTNANVTATMFFDCFENMLDKDDIVLWAPEPGEWTFGSTVMGSMWGGNSKSWEVNAGHYDIFRYIDVSKFTYVFDAYTAYASLHAKNQKAYDSFSPSVSAHGDALDNETSNGGKYAYANEYERRESLFEDDTLDYIAELIGKLTAKGVKVFHTYAAMDENGKDTIDYDYMKNTFSKVFTEKFKGITMISDIKDCFVPTTQMKDSAWHLTRDGAEARTSVVIADLKEALGK